MNNAHPQVNAPITGASITAAVALVLAAFTDFTTDQVAAVVAVVGLLAAFFVQRFHTEPKGVAG